jgi:RNA polymerase sigma-70 factor (ECF subfamily)
MSTAITIQAPEHIQTPSRAEETCHALATHEDDRTLLGRIATQDQEAFERLYTRYAPRVRRYLSRRIGAEDVVDEILHDAMLTLWTSPLRCPLDVPLAAWLCGIARHKAYKSLARRSQAAGASSLPEEHAVEAEEPEHTMVQQEQERLLVRAIDRLPLRERTVITLRLRQEYSYQQIAMMTGEPASTIRTRVSRALQRVRDYVVAVEREQN